MEIGDTAYILARGRRYKGRVEMIHWGSIDQPNPVIKGIYVLVFELHTKLPFLRAPDKVFKTSRAVKEAAAHRAFFA